MNTPDLRRLTLEAVASENNARAQTLNAAASLIPESMTPIASDMLAIANAYKSVSQGATDAVASLTARATAEENVRKLQEAINNGTEAAMEALAEQRAEQDRIDRVALAGV